MAQGRLIAFPLAKAQLNGWPSTVQLTAAEARATERAFLGGMEALRTSDYRVACRTVTALVTKGILGRDGLTPMGRAVGEALARPEVATATPTIDASRMSVDYCRDCGEGHHLIDGLCYDCRRAFATRTAGLFLKAVREQA